MKSGRRGPRPVSPKALPPLRPPRRYSASQIVPHLTIEERVARGRAARAEVPRSSHGAFVPSAGRPDPVALLERFVGSSQYRDNGERVVAGQRLMEAVSDIFLGWQRVIGEDGKEHDYYVRQLRDWKWSPDIGGLSKPAMKIWGRLCAWTLARAHARYGDCIAIAAYLGQSAIFDRAMASFAEAYADQNERDYAAFGKAVKSGRIAAVRGV